MTALLCIASLGFRSPLSDLAAEPTLSIRVRVSNHTQASPTLLAKAQREAGRILGQAGLQIVWIYCPMGKSRAVPGDACLEPCEPSDIVLRILPESTGYGLPTASVGLAIHPFLAAVYYDYVVFRAKNDATESDAPVILACVIAHEIGHLLLGPNGHSLAGIMQPQWEPE